MGRTLSRLLAGVRVPRRATGATAGASASSQPPPYDAAEKKTTTTAEEPPRPRALTLTPSAEQLAALPFTVHVVYARGDEAFAQRLADDLERDAALAGCVRRPLAPSPAEAHLYASHAFVCVLSQRFYGDAACLSDVKHIARLREKKSRVFFFLLSLEGNLTMPMPFRFALGGDTIQRVDFSTGAYDDKLRKFAKPLVRRALEHRGEVPPASEGAADSTVLLFISYAVRNKETVWPLARFLRERAFGEHVWIDAEKIEAGRDWDDQIAEALYGCSAAVVAMSPEFFASVNCTKELKILARRIECKERLRVFPVFLKTRVDVPVQLRFALGELDRVFVITDDPASNDELLSAVKEYVDASTQQLQDQLARHADDVKSAVQKTKEEIATAAAKTTSGVAVVGHRMKDSNDTFKDRVDQQKLVWQALASPRSRTVLIVGKGGMGKTSLACKVLSELEKAPGVAYGDEGAAQLPVGGIMYLSTRTTGINLDLVFHYAGKMLGGAAGERVTKAWSDDTLTVEQKCALLFHELAGKLYVIYLDNAEDLLTDEGRFLDTCASMKAFTDAALASGPHCTAKLIFTSRIPLAVDAGSKNATVNVKLEEGLPMDDAVQLLRELDVTGDCALASASRETLEKLVNLVQGLPRGLEVISTVLATDPFMTPDNLTTSLFAQGTSDAVRDLVEQSFRRLDRRARLIVEALAVFGAVVPISAIQFMVEPQGVSVDVVSIIKRLAVANLVSVQRAQGTVSLHPLDTKFAYSALSEADRVALERRAAAYYACLKVPITEKNYSLELVQPFLEQFNHLVKAGDHDDAMRVLASVDDNVRFREHVNIIDSVVVTMGYEGHRGIALGALDALAGKVKDAQLAMLWYLCRGQILALNGAEGAVAVCEEAIKRAVALGDYWRAAKAHVSLSVVYRYLAAPEKSQLHGQTALDMLTKAVESKGGEDKIDDYLLMNDLTQSEFIMALAAVFSPEPKVDVALRLVDKMQQRAARFNVDEWRISAYNAQYVCHAIRNEPEQTIDIATKLNNLCVATGQHKSVFALIAVALAQFSLGRADESIASFMEALEEGQRLNNLHAQGLASLDLSYIYRTVQQPAKAAEYGEMAREFFTQTKSSHRETAEAVLAVHAADDAAAEVAALLHFARRCDTCPDFVSGLLVARDAARVAAAHGIDAPDVAAYVAGKTRE